MKVGSIVECVNNNGIFHGKPLALNTPYTVREIRKALDYEGLSILLDEVTNGPAPTGREWSYKICRFREIEFPPSLESEIKESLTRQLELI